MAYSLRFEYKKISYDKTAITMLIFIICLFFIYFIKCFYKKKKTNRNFEEKKKKTHVRNSSKESMNEIFNIPNNKINLVTKFNTLLNKLNPLKINKTIYETINKGYNNILGKDRNSYFQTLKNKFAKKVNLKIKKNNMNVRFDDSNLIRDIYI